MHRTQPSTGFGAVLLAITLCATIAGCSGDSGDTAGGDTTTPASVPGTSSPTSGQPSSGSTASTEPTPSRSTFTSTPTSSEPPGSPRSRSKQAQIPAKDLPGLNDEWVWRKRVAGPGPGQDLPAVCLQAPLTSLGAKAGFDYRTDFDSPLSEDDSAVQLTAVFPDQQTAATAVSVLEAWHAQCRTYATKRLGLTNVRVGDISTPSTAVGQGQQWLTTYGPVAGSPDDFWFQALGVVTDGDTMTVLVMTSAGQDYNYPAGKEPMDLALKVAADRLVATR